MADAKQHRDTPDRPAKGWIVWLPLFGDEHFRGRVIDTRESGHVAVQWPNGTAGWHHPSVLEWAGKWSGRQ